MIQKVILADDQTVFRTGAARIMAVEDDFRIVGQCDDLPRLLKAVALNIQPTAIVAATLKPDLASLGRLVKESKGWLIVVLENIMSPKEFLAKGVPGIIYRDVSKIDLLRCLRVVSRGQSFLQQRTGEAAVTHETDVVAERVRERLTPKELMIVGLLLKGYKNRDIAEELGNSEQVIKNYLRSIFDKTGVSDRLELALFAMHHRLASVESTARA